MVMMMIRQILRKYFADVIIEECNGTTTPCCFVWGEIKNSKGEFIMEKISSNSQGINPETKNKCIANEEYPHIVEKNGCSDTEITASQKQERLLGLPICVKDGLYLSPICTCDEQRFADSFADVWLNIPDADRQYILAFWQSEDEWVSPFEGMLDLVVDGVIKKTIRSESPLDPEEYEGEAVWVAETSDADLKFLVAYELAVAKLMADGPMSEFDARLQVIDIENVTRDWGYEDDAFWMLFENKGTIEEYPIPDSI